MTPLTPVLPQELLDLIIDQTRTSSDLQDRPNLNENQDDLEYKTLCTFLLVSRSFRRRALGYVFDRLDFVFTREYSTGFSVSRHFFDSFREVLESCPFPSSTPQHPGWHIHEVSLSFQSVHTVNARGVVGHEGIINMLRSLYKHAPNLYSLAMTIDRGLPLDWNCLDAGYQEAFHALVRLKSLKILKTTNVLLYPVTFLKGTHLISLHISEDRPSWLFDVYDRVFAPADPADIDLPDPALEMLTTDHTHPFGAVPGVSPPGSIFSGLKALRSIGRNPRAIQQTWTIFSAAPLLQKIYLEFHGKCYFIVPSTLSSFHQILISRPGEIENPPPSLNLANLPDLKFLSLDHVRLKNLPYNSTNDENLAKILDFLEPATPLAHFEELHLKFLFNEHNVETNFFHPAPGSGVSQWEQLDMLLLGPKYPALKTVMISLVVHVWVSEHFEDFENEASLVSTKQKLQEQFPRLASTDRVNFKLNSESQETRLLTLW